MDTVLTPLHHYTAEFHLALLYHYMHGAKTNERR
jgi:hypothetical protein